ncbi:MAG: hypothetical protein PUJ52_06425 [Firmicutes bacterium]|nr:hypothetical protein [Bacillota bacterium]
MILSYIRKNQCKRLFYPLMLLGVVIFLVWRSPVTEYVTKRTISNAVLINDSMAKKVLYAKIKTGTLYYSGEDCLAGGELVGHYYYELIGGSCHFYLIRAVAGYPASKTLEGQTIIGRVDAFEPEILDPLTQKLAEDISWDAKSLKSVCQKYFVNQTAYLNKREIVLMVVLLLVFVLMIVVFIRTILYIINPRLTKTYRNLEHYGNPEKILNDVEKQIRRRILLQTKTLILTPRYLVELSDDICAIIPLPEVLWIYDHAAMRRTIKGRQLSYTIHVVTMKGEEYTLTGKSHREVSAIYHELNTRYPNFFFGYSKEHQEMVQYVLHEMKNEKA